MFYLHSPSTRGKSVLLPCDSSCNLQRWSFCPVECLLQTPGLQGLHLFIPRQGPSPQLSLSRFFVLGRPLTFQSSASYVRGRGWRVQEDVCGGPDWTARTWKERKRRYQLMDVDRVKPCADQKWEEGKEDGRKQRWGHWPIRESWPRPAATL